jgi:hypothetical protein
VRGLAVPSGFHAALAGAGRDWTVHQVGDLAPLRLDG